MVLFSFQLIPMHCLAADMDDALLNQTLCVWVG